MGKAESAKQNTMDEQLQSAGYYLQYASSKGGWRDLYFFHLKQCTEEDFAIYNWWCATSPDAPMMNMKIAAVQTEHGRITYNGEEVRVFACTHDDSEKLVEVVQTCSQDNLDRLLLSKFGIQIT